MGSANRLRWRGFRVWHLVVAGLVSAAAGAAVDIATATPDQWGWIAAAGLLVVGTIGLGVWEARRDAGAESARAVVARAEVMDPHWPTPPASTESGLDAPADGLLFWLRAPFCPSPLRGRSDVVRSLTEWCATGTDHVRIVSGPPGVGKSRLVVEVARRLGEDWFTGKPDTARLAEAVARVVECGGRALLVVEDAERIPDVARLVAQVGTTDGLVRLVLTSRDGTGLRQRLRQDPDTSLGPALRAPVIELAPIGHAGDRQRWYAEAVHGYAHALRMPRPDVIDTAPVGHDGDSMLLLQARALLAVLNRPGSNALALADVARELVGRETRRWAGDSHAALPATITGDVLAQALAVLSLLPGSAALRRLPTLAADSAEQHRLAIVAWAESRYPRAATGRLEPHPELIGEWLILDTLAAVPTLAADLPDSAVAVVVRACLTYPDQLPRLWTVLRADPDRLPELIPVVLREVGDRSSARIDVHIAELVAAADPGLAAALLALDLPQDYVHTHVALLRIRIRGLRAADDRDALAAAVTAFGRGLRLVGRRQEALAADREAVALWRALEPDRHRDDLAVALTNLGNTSSQLGLHREALAVREEVVAIWRDVYDVEPERYRFPFASAVSNVAGSLAQVGRHEEALRAWHQAVALWRELAADPGHRATLAVVLSGLCLILRETGHPPEAVAAGQEAAAIWRALPATELDSHRAEFAATLAKLGAALWATGQYRDALVPAEEAVTQWRRLTTAQPDRHRPELAEALTNLGVVLATSGRPREAVAVSREAVALWRNLAAAEPGHHRPRLANGLAQLTVALTDADDHRAAVKAGEEAVQLWRALATTDPDRHRPDLAMALNNVGTSQERAGNRAQAVTSWQEARELLKQCADRDPQRYGRQHAQLTKLLNET